MNMQECLERLTSRRDGQRNWLKREFPQIFKEQGHLDTGSVERYYWHYGYAVAITDILNLLQKVLEDVA